MKYSIIESVFLGDYKSIVDLELFTSRFFFFFNGTPPPPTNTALIKHSFALFFKRWKFISGKRTTWGSVY